jgi:hypothetical protein
MGAREVTDFLTHLARDREPPLRTASPAT